MKPPKPLPRTPSAPPNGGGVGCASACRAHALDVPSSKAFLSGVSGRRDALPSAGRAEALPSPRHRIPASRLHPESIPRMAAPPKPRSASSGASFASACARPSGAKAVFVRCAGACFAESLRASASPPPRPSPASGFHALVPPLLLRLLAPEVERPPVSLPPAPPAEGAKGSLPLPPPAEGVPSAAYGGYIVGFAVGTQDPPTLIMVR
jgi:hypothetical protein